MRKTLLAVSLLSLLMFAACGGSDKEFEEQLRKAAGGGGGTGPALTATLKGKITFDGPPPVLKPITTSSDPGCKNPNLPPETIVVSDGGLENVMVYVSGGNTNTFPVPAEPVTLNQEGCHYIPHVFTLQVGQKLKIVNSDETAHNVHAWPEINKGFNVSQSSKGVSHEFSFDKEEVLLPVRCDVHNWMNAFIGVFTHPLAAVSKKGGAYEFKLPPGTYTITAQHETLGKQDMMVTVAEGGTAELNFTFKPK
jgi:plastocyanin